MKRKSLAHVLLVLVRVCATAAVLCCGNVLLGRLFEWTPFGIPIWNFASACAACLAAFFAFVVLMEVLWGRNGSRVACVFCGAMPLLLVAEPFIAAAGLCDQQAEWTGAAVGLFALPVFVVLFRKAGTLVPGRFRRPQWRRRSAAAQRGTRDRWTGRCRSRPAQRCRSPKPR